MGKSLVSCFFDSRCSIKTDTIVKERSSNYKERLTTSITINYANSQQIFDKVNKVVSNVQDRPAKSTIMSTIGLLIYY